ncbi:hypothetical protein PROFUN_01980 [Planoprotostelium fungivorum]|uniref:Uncharacterized protein n=1 Tax=Planoprotostelium fungivorum TaxID=1890364 RepID=A0A2P6NB20_9EUKA|nr:hypothetical protein PROFUN_01980 [Planoprotostelium fungivorum]
MLRSAAAFRGLTSVRPTPIHIQRTYATKGVDVQSYLQKVIPNLEKELSKIEEEAAAARKALGTPKDRARAAFEAELSKEPKDSVATEAMRKALTQ